MSESETLADCAARLGLSIRATFVPFSQSRNSKESMRSLNWRVTLVQRGRDILETDYSAGVGHAPSYKNPPRFRGGTTPGAIDKYRQRLAIDYETENGFTARLGSSDDYIFRGAPIEPDTLSVLHSLAMDSDVLDYATFESWAPELGYDPDSRKAESIYRACITIALQLRNGIGETALAELRRAAADY